MWTGGELHLTDEARAVAVAVAFRIPMPRHMHPSREVHNLVLAGTLPEPVKRMFAVRWTRFHEAAYRSVVAGIRAGRPLAPERVRRGTNTSSFDLVARTERSLVTGGRATLPSQVASVG
jgi:uncharacterized protein (DUF2236 family)